MSLDKAAQNLHIEVIVVDNHSSDDSVQMVSEKFPRVGLIENDKNVGFSAANNQAISQSKGKYVLLLNPDTILSEDTLTACFNFMETHKDAGAVCVKMIDGSGEYLPESKRGKPTLRASLFKMTGIYKLFPKSRFFNSYYAGHLDENVESNIEVMTGAFMFLRKEVIDKIGLLDTSFFMYGEDIDYSYRIMEAGYKNYYLPSSTIIHFKGESTKKSTLNYTKIFYNAMIIFVKKHYKGRGQLYIIALQAVVILRALAAMLQVWVLKVLPVLVDLVLIYYVVIGLKNWWVQFYFNNPRHINDSFESFNAPFYALIWIITALITGHYKKFSSWQKIFKTMVFGTGIILIVYGLLDVEYRNSRLLIIIGAFGAGLILTITKLIKNYFQFKTFGFAPNKTINYTVVGSPEECNRIVQLIDTEKDKIKFQGRVSIDEDKLPNIGSIQYLADIIEAYHINEVIFSQKDTPAGLMMQTMSHMKKDVDFRVAPNDALSIISSRSKDKQGELITVGLSYEINTSVGSSNKRIFDVIAAGIILILSPIFMFFNKNKGVFLKNVWNVMTGKHSFVGYLSPIDPKLLPDIKKGIIPCSNYKNTGIDQALIDQENLYYARNYTWWKDLEILYKNIDKLDGEYDRSSPAI